MWKCGRYSVKWWLDEHISPCAPLILLVWKKKFDYDLIFSKFTYFRNLNRSTPKFTIGLVFWKFNCTVSFIFKAYNILNTLEKSGDHRKNTLFQGSIYLKEPVSQMGIVPRIHTNTSLEFLLYNTTKLSHNIKNTDVIGIK